MHGCPVRCPPAPHHAARPLLQHVLVLIGKREQRVVERACVAGGQAGHGKRACCGEGAHTFLGVHRCGRRACSPSHSTRPWQPLVCRPGHSRNDSSMTRKNSRPSVLRALRGTAQHGMHSSHGACIRARQAHVPVPAACASCLCQRSPVGAQRAGVGSGGSSSSTSSSILRAGRQADHALKRSAPQQRDVLPRLPPAQAGQQADHRRLHNVLG